MVQRNYYYNLPFRLSISMYRLRDEELQCLFADIHNQLSKVNLEDYSSVEDLAMASSYLHKFVNQPIEEYSPVEVERFELILKYVQISINAKKEADNQKFRAEKLRIERQKIKSISLDQFQAAVERLIFLLREELPDDKLLSLSGKLNLLLRDVVSSSINY